MSIATEIQRLQTAKTDVRTSLLKKGIYIPTDTLVSSFSTYIDDETPIPWKDNPSNYLSFYFIENGSVQWSTSANKAIYYSKDEGTTWTYIGDSTTTVSMNVNEEIWFKRTDSSGTATGSSYYSSFVTTGKFFVRGDITSLCNFSKTLTTYHFGYLFSKCTGLNIHKDAPLIFPRTTASCCYLGMFKDCTSLTNIPVLPATIMTERCYSGMFNGCTALKTVSILPATTLANNCYHQMFYGCDSLINAPVLPATTLAIGCYQQMFRNCTSLEIAPELPAITLVSTCYTGLFRGCSNLKYIKAMFTTTPTASYTASWVQYVPPTGTFVKNSEAEWTTTGISGIPNGWTVETASA